MRRSATVSASASAAASPSQSLGSHLDSAEDRGARKISSMDSRSRTSSAASRPSPVPLSSAARKISIGNLSGKDSSGKESSGKESSDREDSSKDRTELKARRTLPKKIKAVSLFGNLF